MKAPMRMLVVLLGILPSWGAGQVSPPIWNTYRTSYGLRVDYPSDGTVKEYTKDASENPLIERASGITVYTPPNCKVDVVVQGGIARKNPGAQTRVSKLMVDRHPATRLDDRYQTTMGNSQNVVTSHNLHISLTPPLEQWPDLHINLRYEVPHTECLPIFDRLISSVRLPADFSPRPGLSVPELPKTFAWKEQTKTSDDDRKSLGVQSPDFSRYKVVALPGKLYMAEKRSNELKVGAHRSVGGPLVQYFESYLYLVGYKQVNLVVADAGVVLSGLSADGPDGGSVGYVNHVDGKLRALRLSFHHKQGSELHTFSVFVSDVVELEKVLPDEFRR